MNIEESGDGSEEMPGRAAFRLALSRWRLIAALAVTGAILGVLAALTQPTLFEAVATLLVTQPKFANEPAPKVDVSSFHALFETNTLGNDVIEHFGLGKPPTNLTATALSRDVLIVEEVRNTNLIKLRVRWPDSKLASQLGNFLASETVAFSQRIDAQQGADFRGQLKTQLDDATARLRASEAKLLDFQKGAQLELGKRDADSALDVRGDLLRLTADIASEKAKLTVAETELKRQPRVLSVPRLVGAEAALRAAAQAAEPVTPPQERKAPEKDKDKDKDNDQAKGSPSPPRETPATDAPSRAGDELDLTNPFVNPVYQVLDYQIALSRTRLAGLSRRRDELMNVLHIGGKQLESLARLYPDEIQMDRLEAEHQLAKTLYAEVAQHYERALLQIATSSAQLQVVDAAVEPTEPLPRHRGLYALLGMSLGVALAVFIIIIAGAHLAGPTRRSPQRT